MPESTRLVVTTTAPAPTYEFVFIQKILGLILFLGAVFNHVD